MGGPSRSLLFILLLLVVSACDRQAPPDAGSARAPDVEAQVPAADAQDDASGQAGSDASDPIARIEAVRQVARGNPLDGGKATVDVIIQGLEDSNGEVRQMAATVAVEGANYHARFKQTGAPLPYDWSQEPELVAALQRAAASDDPLVAGPALTAYGRIVEPSPDVEAFLVGRFADAPAGVQQAVLPLLDEHGATSAAYTDLLAQARANADPTVRTLAAHSTLRVMGADAVPALEAMLEAEQEPLVEASIRALLAQAQSTP